LSQALPDVGRLIISLAETHIPPPVVCTTFALAVACASIKVPEIRANAMIRLMILKVVLFIVFS
jgi:hypothetical protein